MNGTAGAPGPPRASPGDAREAGRSVAPPWLDPILSLAEVVDRRRRHIRAIRRDGVLGLETGRHHGPSLRLSDGSIVGHIALVGYLHLRNDRVAVLAAHGWQSSGYREARQDLAALVRWWERQPVPERPIAFTATTVLAPFARRDGWELRPRTLTPRARLDDCWMSWLLVHFNLAGRGRLARAHHRLRSSEVWLSGPALAARYDGGPPSST